MPNMISTCGGFFEDLTQNILNVGRSYLQQRQDIEAAKAANKISQQQAEQLLAQARAQAEIEKVQSEASFKKKLPLYIGLGVAGLAAIYFLSRRRR